MRMNKIPRGVQNPMEGGPTNFNLVAEPIELGTGVQDPHVQHTQQNGMTEAEWFQRAEQMPADPRYAPSYMHQSQQPQQYARPRTELEHVVDGVVVGALMQKDGAHLEISTFDGQTKFAVFCEDTPLVRLGLRVRISEKTTHDTQTGDVLKSEIVVEDIDG